MIPTELLDQWQAGLTDGSIVPYLGPGVLADVTSKLDGRPIPATGEQLILAMNNGQPMAPKLMYEFPRAAMNRFTTSSTWFSIWSPWPSLDLSWNISTR